MISQYLWRFFLLSLSTVPPILMVFFATRYSAALHSIGSIGATVTESTHQVVSSQYGGTVTVFDTYWFQYNGNAYTGNDYRSFPLQSPLWRDFTNQNTVPVYFDKTNPSDNGFTPAVGAVGGWFAGLIIFTILSICSLPAFFYMICNIGCAVRRDMCGRRRVSDENAFESCNNDESVRSVDSASE
jgi:hypothetical protein